jgi:RNA polymerase-binding transcription factor DksA
VPVPNLGTGLLLLEAVVDTAGATMLDEGQLDALRAALVRIREENEADLASARATLAQLTDDHTLGSGSLREVAANAEYMIEDATGILAMVDAAMRRIDAGTYGTCTSCGGPIGFERLELRPQVPTCVPCSA